MGKVKMGELWSLAETHLPNNLLELQVVCLVRIAFMSTIQGGLVQILTDNTTSM